MNIQCFLGFHLLKADKRPINGVWWAFCSRCGARFAGEYDPAYGTTKWSRDEGRRSMTEREQLEYAAKAMGIKVRCLEGLDGAVYVAVADEKPWNPKVDDGDSRRLQNATRVSLIYPAAMPDVVQALAFAPDTIEGRYTATEPIGTDLDAAVRLAVFKVAVEVGKAMQDKESTA